MANEPMTDPERRAPPFDIHFLAQGVGIYPCGLKHGDASTSKRQVTCAACRERMALKPITNERRARTIRTWNRAGA